MIRTNLLSSLAIVGVALGACRPMPEGAPRYPVYEPFADGDQLLGPFPFEEGDERLYFGAFYEAASGFSEVIEIDNTTTNYFIYESTYTQQPSDDRVEGVDSAEFTLTDAQPWWGGGIVYGANFDLSEWTTLHASFKAPDSEPSFEAMDILVESEGPVSARVKPADYGFAADGDWHSVVIPLEDFVGVDFTRLRIPVSFVADAGPTGAVLLIDDVYYTQE